MKRTLATFAFLALMMSSCSNSDPAEQKRSPSAVEPLAVNDANFEQEVLRSKVPVLVDFWAPWCGPCVAIGPVVDEVAGELAGKVKVVKLNVDVGTQTAAQYQIKGIPTFILFKDGAIAQRTEGAPGRTKAAFVAWVNSALP